MSDMVRSAIDDVVITIEPGDHQFPVAPMVANYINQLQRENRKFRDLSQEVWGVLVSAVLMDKTSDPNVRKALTRVDRRLREAGLFPQTPVAMGLPESSERQLKGRE